jgi:glyoxalase family protein
MPPVTGIHHVTAICGDVQANLDFYTGVLGLRLVKVAVNFDDPTTYHTYFGDGLGRPGTLITFFPYPDSYKGRAGSGSVVATAYAVPPGSLRWWMDRLAERAIDFEGPRKRGDEEFVTLQDPDGIVIEIVASPTHPSPEPWAQMPVPSEHAIGCIHGVTLCEEASEFTIDFLVDALGFREIEAFCEDRRRFEAGVGGSGTLVDVVCRPDAPHGRGGQGSVHHVAFRTPHEESQAHILADIRARGINVSPVMNRNYFKSIYFREPGGVLFEVATDGPGMTFDETPETLGSSLRLPEQYEPMREKIEAILPPLRRP